ncbi:MAG: hypothetical protein GKR94_28070 [Gammaproteobacteria bacterium]|nr:hypothetical protein [Gammaproteobacteria bacterium]
MNLELHRALRAARFDDEANRGRRTLFALRCAERVRHLVIDERVLQIMDAAIAALATAPDNVEALAGDAGEMARIASRHPGTNSIDGSGSAAVSATYAVAKAMAGDALAAADYAAYAKVYSYASYMVTHPAAYADEHRWQLALLVQMMTSGSS